LIDAGANASAKLPTSFRESKGGFKCGGDAAAEKRDDRNGILTLFPNRLMKSAILSPSQSQQTPIREIDMAKVKLIAAV